MDDTEGWLHQKGTTLTNRKITILLYACRIFLHRMIDLSTTVKHLNHHILLTTEAQLDIQWWVSYWPRWSGKSLILWVPLPVLHLYTDASWFQGILVRKVAAIPLDPQAAAHGQYLHRRNCLRLYLQWLHVLILVLLKNILFHCDNQSGVATWEKFTCATHISMTAVLSMLYITI